MREDLHPAPPVKRASLAESASARLRGLRHGELAEESGPEIRKLGIQGDGGTSSRGDDERLYGQQLLCRKRSSAHAFFEDSSGHEVNAWRPRAGS